jgi:hypothetical protein
MQMTTIVAATSTATQDPANSSAVRTKSTLGEMFTGNAGKSLAQLTPVLYGVSNVLVTK